MLVLENPHGGIQGGAVAGDHVLGRGVEVGYLDHAVSSCLTQSVENGILLSGKNRGHGPAGTSVIGGTARGHEPQRSVERQRSNMDKMVVLAQAQARGTVALEAGVTQQLPVRVVRQEHRKLHIFIARSFALQGVELINTAAEHL